MRIAQGARTSNEILKCLIELERRITPSDRNLLIADIDRLLDKVGWKRAMELRTLDLLIDRDAFRLADSRALRPARVLSVLRHWKVQLAGHAGHAHGQQVRPFTRVWARRGKTLFRPTNGQSSNLLICFTDRMGRLMMSVADFLQALVEDRDVLVVSPRLGRSFEEGIIGFGADLGSGVGGLTRFVKGLGYGSVSVLGTSLGCNAAFLCAVQINAQNLVLAGPSERTLTLIKSHYRSLPRSGSEAAVFTPLKGATVYFGLEAPTDVQVAEQLRAMWGWDLVGVPDTGHVCLYPLLERSQLREALLHSLPV